MLISTEIGSFYKYGDNKEVIRMLKKSGFYACDFSMMLNGRNDALIDKDDYIAQAKALRSFANGEGIVFNQSHSPFPSAKVGDEQYNAKQLDKIRRALEVSGILGVKVCVVHPCNFYCAEKNAEEVFLPLEKTAKDVGVIVGLENMWCWDDKENHAVPAACSDPKSFLQHLSLLDERVFCACLDIGHAEMKGLDTSAEEMILNLDNRLKAIHLHDNDKVLDLHRPPFTGKIDYLPIISALKKVNYGGDITFEADMFTSLMPTALYPAAAKYLSSVGDYFKSAIKNSPHERNAD